jgi:hypothetical protein
MGRLPQIHQFMIAANQRIWQANSHEDAQSHFVSLRRDLFLRSRDPRPDGANRQHRDTGAAGGAYYEQALQELNSDPAYLRLWSSQPE